ncbi:hypothetical protein FACS1894217_01300 [Clostridia bacterium]|nr:hypothetical protein FACS1894217_01300 [Clostridia bacterium]
MLNATIIGERITTARKNKNLSQSALGELLSISSQAVGKWERGESMPDILTFNSLARTLDVDLNYFSEFPSDPAVPQQTAAEPPANHHNMSAANWRDADFSGLRGLKGKLSGSNIINCKFVGSDLGATILKANVAANCDFSDSTLAGSKFHASNIKHCNFTNADFTGASFKTSPITKSILTGAIWKRTEFNAVSFTDIVFQGELTDCSFVNCGFTKTEFRNVTFRDCFFKNGKMKNVKFTDCKADNLTYAFLKSAKANMDGVTLIES